MPTKPSSLISENEIIRLLRRRFAGRDPSIKNGIGDDAAVLRPAGGGELWVLTTDLLLEDIHFRLAETTPQQLGHKSLAVNLSDVAAMGTRPRFYTVALGLPRTVSREWILNFYQGMTELGRRHGALLVGGDMSGSKSEVYICVSVLGETVKRRVLYRGGGKPGDLLYVTGTLGRSAAGLKLLEAGQRKGTTPAEQEAIRAHREPEPRCAAGLWLAKQGLVRAMMDLSDGLSADLPKLCAESGAGAEIYTSQLPLFEGSRGWASEPLELALHGGEDYELLFAVSPRKAAHLEAVYPRTYPPITKIGTMTSRRGVFWMEKPGQSARRLPERGYDHFRVRPEKFSAEARRR